MLLAEKNNLQKVVLIMQKTTRNLVALTIVMGVCGTFKVDLKYTLMRGGIGKRLPQSADRIGWLTRGYVRCKSLPHIS